MNCQEVDPSLAAYLHGEVGRSERELIQAHIAQCQRCQNELSLLSELQSDLTRSLHAVGDSAAPSPAAWARLQASLAPQRQPTLADRVKHTFGSGIANWAVPRTLLLLASTVIVSAVAIGLIALPRTELQPQPAVDAVATSVPAAAPAEPVVVPAAPPGDARRISGPIDEPSLLPQPMADEPATVLVASDSDMSAGTTSTGVGGWVFVQNPSQEGVPYRACASCAPFQ